MCHCTHSGPFKRDSFLWGGGTQIDGGSNPGGYNSLKKDEKVAEEEEEEREEEEEEENETLR